MKSEQIKEITDRAAEQLVAALQAGHSETLTAYLRAIGRFHHYSLLCAPQHNKLYVCCRTMLSSHSVGRAWSGPSREI
jgi:hypothetical protein